MNYKKLLIILFILTLVLLVDTAYCMEPSGLSPENKISIYCEYVKSTRVAGHNLVDLIHTDIKLKYYILECNTEQQIKKTTDIYFSGFLEGVGKSIKK